MSAAGPLRGGSGAAASYAIVIVTFRRATALARVLEALSEQTHPPARVVVVDNDPTPSVRRLCEREMPAEIEYLAAAENLGPAGGSQLALDHLWSTGVQTTWVSRIDDDRPPATSDIFERLLRIATEAHASDQRVAGVGRFGARWNAGKALLEVPFELEDAEDERLVDVDYLATGHLPVFRSDALRDVGGFAPELFYGLTEVDLGIRLRSRGYRLLVPSGLADKESVADARSRTSRRDITEPYDWRRYYSMRNLVTILLRHESTTAALRVAVVRGLLKPFVSLFRGRSEALQYLRWNSRAIYHAFTGRMGRTTDPLDWTRADSDELPPT